MVQYEFVPYSTLFRNVVYIIIYFKWLTFFPHMFALNIYFDIHFIVSEQLTLSFMYDCS